jgi:fatty-acyl-CoA synthase
LSTAPETIADLLLARLGDDRPGLRTRERDWTWDEVVRASAVRASLARELRRDGPFHIGVLLENVPEYLFWLGGAALAGATLVGINPTRRGAGLEQEVRHTDLQLVITDRTGWALLDGLDIGVGRDRFLLVDDEEEYGTLVSRCDGEPVRDPSITATTPMLLMFTSGTTGASKAARCSQGRLVESGRVMGTKFDVTREDITYCPMPLFHGNALMAVWAPALTAGSTIALPRRFSASEFLTDVRDFGATYFSYVGKAIAYILATPERPDDRDNPLTHAFGTEASPQDQAEFGRRFGCRLIEGYGSSESGGMIVRTPDTPPTALGRPAHAGVRVVHPSTRVTCDPAVLDAHGRLTNADQAVGELVDVNGAAAFEGYYNNPEADAERVRHGWYWTGDLGYLDEAGFLYFAGRSGDWIRVDGENISALPTQLALRRHPKVIDAVAFGVPDPRSGDLVMAAIEIPEGTGFDDLDLASFLARQEDLGTKGAPRYVRVSHALPTTGSGKLSKAQTRSEAWNTEDPVYQWNGRGAPAYTLMTADDRTALHAEFETNGRLRFLP